MAGRDIASKCHMTEDLNIILGAGFSCDAGIPLGKGVDAYFDRDVREKLLRFSSSEWMWTDDKDSTTLHNGKIGYDWLGYSYVLFGLINRYKSDSKKFVGYEHFYQHFIDNVGNSEWITSIFDLAKEKLIETENPSTDYLYLFDNPQIKELDNIINYLIADTLGIKGDEEELLRTYGPFLNLMNQYKTVNVFTLNHDMLVEYLLKASDLKYTDGFTRDNSIIIFEDSPLDTYQNQFDNCGIRIYKLHGSIDTYMFEICDEEGSFSYRTGEYIYYKPKGYHEKHMAKRIDLSSKAIVQHRNHDVTPKFITGTDKKGFIEDDKMYSDLLTRLDNDLQSNNDLLLIGYSYQDEHINELLEKHVSVTPRKIININPNNKFMLGSIEGLTEYEQVGELVSEVS